MTLYTPNSAEVQPGDFAAVKVHGDVGKLIRLGEILNGDGFRDYEHAIWYVGGKQDLILEAEAGGAVLRPFHVDPSDCLWSSDNPALTLSADQRDQVLAVAQRYKGTPYSAADYFALAAHRLHIPAPHLKAFVAETGHMICSQLVDTCRLAIGSHLFDDGRWPGYVTPLALADLICGGKI